MMKRKDSPGATAKAQACVAQGVALHRAGRLAPAQTLYEQALRLDARCFDALQLLGAIHARSAAKLARAIELFDAALAIDPKSAAVHYNRALALYDAGRPEEALRGYDETLRLEPSHAKAHWNRGVVLRALGRLDEAMACYHEVLRLEPGFAAAHCNLGNALSLQRRWEDALASYEAAVRIEPVMAEAWMGAVMALSALGHLTNALAGTERAIRARPDYADAWAGRAETLAELGRHPEALPCFDRALQLKPDFDYVVGKRLHAQMQVCDWSGLDERRADVLAQLAQGRRASSPLPVLAITDSLALQRAAARTWIADKAPPDPDLGPMPARTRPGKLKVAYFSMDFRQHAVAYLTAELFELHDRSRFEIHAYSFGNDTGDPMRRRLEAAFDRFTDVQGLSDRQVAQLARDAGIDIAVDLGGLTHDSRPGIFALRAAPVQVNYIGYPGTMGAPWADYIIGDETLIPRQLAHGYDEQVAYLPCFQVNDRTRPISTHRFTREELGLPASGFVFCCFNRNYKITPAVFDAWMRILQAVPGGVLLLHTTHDAACTNLRKEAAARGVDAQRLHFAGHLPIEEYLARYRVADLFLDTFPFNGGTTVSDALWAGLPVLTRPGEAYASRMAASLLRAIGLPELVAADEADYERMAIGLATEGGRLGEFSERLSRNRGITALFDTPMFTAHLEEAYLQMIERREADLPPAMLDATRLRTAQG